MPRNSSGTYSLPSGNPVVSGTLIEATWANTTLSDLASAMTNSLSRNGEGGMTAALRIADGTASVPGLAFTNETNSGLYRAGSGDMRLSIAGGTVAQFLATGVAITGTLSASGNTTVGGTLGVTGATTLSSTLGVTGAATLSNNLTFNGTGARIIGDFSNATVASRTIFQTSTTNGATIIPAMPNGTETTSIFRAYNNSTPTNASYGELRAGASAIELIANREGSGTLLPLSFSTGNATRMTIDVSGNVGVGVTPVSRLDVSSVSRVRWDISGAEVSQLATNAAANAYAVQNFDAASYSFKTGGSTKVSVDASGNVGIGTSSPATKFHVSGAGDVTGRIQSTNAGTYFDLETAAPAADYKCFWGTTGGTRKWGIGNFGTGNDNVLAFYIGTTERARIDSSGNLLVGATDVSLTASPGLKMYGNVGCSAVSTNSTNSNSAHHLYSTTAGAFRFYVGWGGTIFATSTSISALSDITLKENVRDLETGLDTVMALRPRRFDWKNGDGKDVAGFIAQEVEPVMPDLVYDYQYSSEETKKSLKMGDMVPTLVKAIQEQQALIQSLTQRIAALEGASDAVAS